MEYRTSEESGVTVVHLSGEVEVSAALTLREVLGGLLSGADSRVLVDLREVSFIDSSGMGIFVTAHRLAADQGGVFALAEPQELAGKIFELTRADRLLRIFPTVGEGIGALAGG